MPSECNQLDRVVEAPMPMREPYLRHVFDATLPFTVGAEEELLLVEPETDRLAPVARRALALLDDGGRFVAELRRSQIELVTPVCSTAADVARELAYARTLASGRLAELARLVAAGVHPTALEAGPVSAGRRYADIIAANPQVERRLLSCGLHVHVSVGGADRSLAVYNALRDYLPEVVALAANAPFHEARDSGLATARPGLNRMLPRSGVPPAFASWAAYADFCAWAARGLVALDAGYHWWDIRLHPRYGTIEVRAADVQTSTRDTATVIALVHCLAFSLAARYDEGEALPATASERIAENIFLAARDGLRGSLIDDRGDRRWTSARLFELVDELLPAAGELGCIDELLGVERMVAEGGGATRQRDYVRAAGIGELCDRLADETCARPVVLRGSPGAYSGDTGAAPGAAPPELAA